MTKEDFERFKKEFQQKIECWCPCHIDEKNQFAFDSFIHCDNCYDKRVYNWDRYMK